jgi:putative two-component system response regulator
MSSEDISILVVDDSKTDVAVIIGILEGYRLYVAHNGIEAMKIIKENPDIGIVLLDLNMPLMDGFQVLKEIDSEAKLKYLNVIILTNYEEVENEIKGLELGAVDYIRKPLKSPVIEKTDRSPRQAPARKTKTGALQRRSGEAVALRTVELVVTRDMTIRALLSLLEARDIESSNHTKRTQLMMRALCKHIRQKDKYGDILTDEYIELLCSATPLHDIGKIGIPDSILFKPGNCRKKNSRS